MRNGVVAQATKEDGEDTPIGLFASALQHSFLIWG